MEQDLVKVPPPRSDGRSPRGSGLSYRRSPSTRESCGDGYRFHTDTLITERYSTLLEAVIRTCAVSLAVILGRFQRPAADG